MSVLTDIQNELKAPKNRMNSFGGYKYRSCEDILEAVKPILKKYDATLIMYDHVAEVGGRVYVVANASLEAGGTTYCVTAYAREAENKKGMDDSQITGTASTYARKYALNGLFLIDDTKDADTEEYEEEVTNQKMIAAVANNQIGKVRGEALEQQLNEAGVNIDKLKAQRGVKELSELTEEQHASIIRKLGG